MLFILAGACSKSSAPTYDIPGEARSEASATRLVLTGRAGDVPVSVTLDNGSAQFEIRIVGIEPESEAA